jgi:hypothetical protein
MDYVQVTDVLEQTQLLQHIVCQCAISEKERAATEPLEEAYADVCRHAGRVERLLDDLRATLPQHQLIAWISFPQMDSLNSTIETLRTDRMREAKAGLRQILAAETALVRIYDQALQQTHVLMYRKLFDELRKLESQHIGALARRLSELQ